MMILPYEPPWAVRSSGLGLLVIPNVRTQTHNKASFHYYDPHLWKSLPENLKAAENADIC